MDDSRRFLRFPQAVLKDFAFLQALGLRVDETNETYVRYEGATASFEVFHGRQSYELGVNVVLEGVRYSLHELLELKASAQSSANTFQTFAATDAHGVEVGVARLASALKECTQMILSNSRAVYDRLNKQRETNRAKLASDSLIAQVRPKADEAFRSKNYALAAELYESIRERLSPTELRRLEVAKSRGLGDRR